MTVLRKIRAMRNLAPSKYTGIILLAALAVFLGLSFVSRSVICRSDSSGDMPKRETSPATASGLTLSHSLDLSRPTKANEALPTPTTR